MCCPDEKNGFEEEAAKKTAKKKRLTPNGARVGAHDAFFLFCGLLRLLPSN
jgi:hypothetical protein